MCGGSNGGYYANGGGGGIGCGGQDGTLWPCSRD